MHLNQYSYLGALPISGVCAFSSLCTHECPLLFTVVVVGNDLCPDVVFVLRTQFTKWNEVDI